MILESLQKCKPVDQATRKRNLFVVQKEYWALDTRTRIGGIENRSAERLKTFFFVQAKFTRTLCVWTIHVLKENNSAIVIPIVRFECATHRNFSQLFHTCLQRNIVSCIDGDFCDS